MRRAYPSDFNKAVNVGRNRTRDEALQMESELLALDAAQSKLERFNLEAGTAETMRLPSELLGPVFSAGEVGWFSLRGDGSAFVELPSLASTAGTVEFASARPGDSRAGGDLDVRVPWRNGSLARHAPLRYVQERMKRGRTQSPCMEPPHEPETD